MEGRSWATGAYWCRNKSSRQPINILDTAANSQDGSSLEFVAAAGAREYNIQDAKGGGRGSMMMSYIKYEIIKRFRKDRALGVKKKSQCQAPA